MIDKITCPNCGHTFDVEEALAGKIEAHLKAEYEKKAALQAEKFKIDREKLQKEKEAIQKEKELFEEKKEQENEIFRKKLEEKLQEGLLKEREKLQRQTQEQFNLKLKALQEENEIKQKELQTLRKQEVELLRREQNLKEQAENLKINLDKKLLEKQSEIEEKAKAQEREKMLLKEKEYQKQLEDQKKLIDEMKRKAEQGSMQLQGEIQELAIEELLSTNYPFDRIEEVPKGIRGADCIQTVVNRNQKVCGSIVYESKRTKNFTNDWIDKLKHDQISCKADIAVIVTQTYPKDMTSFGQKDGVWICSFSELSSLSFVLREMLIQTHSVKASEENKGDKMELLYSYLTSNEFVQNIKRIVEVYDNMITQLNSEKKAMHKIWSQREKQIWVVQENISQLFGSIKGIAGKELSSSAALELPDIEIEE
jgi:hypothetical protein